MTWTYGGDPASNDRDAVRFLIQDIDTNNQLANDEEIAWVLTEEHNVYTAAAEVLGAIVRREAGIGSKKVGDLSITFDAVAAQARVDYLRKKGRAQYEVPTAGGISISEKDSLEADSDWPRPFFKRKQFDFTTHAGDSDEIEDL